MNNEPLSITPESLVMTPLRRDDPRMIAWNEYVKTPEFGNTRSWPIKHPITHIDGALWAAFLVGYEKGQNAAAGIRSAALDPKVRDFVCWIVQDQVWEWGERGGGDVQDRAIAAGILAPHEATAPCGEFCRCAEYDGDFPLTCYRFTEAFAEGTIRQAFEGNPPVTNIGPSEGVGAERKDGEAHSESPAVSPSPSAPNGLREAAQPFLRFLELAEELQFNPRHEPARVRTDTATAAIAIADFQALRAALAASPAHREMKWPDVEPYGATQPSNGATE